MQRFWHLGTVCVSVFLATTVGAGDAETLRLDLKSKPVLLSHDFMHDARAVPAADDVEDVHYRYWRGYSRGYYGGGYYLPRLYAFRSGYAAGYHRGGYAPRYYGSYYSVFSYSYPTVRYYYPPVYRSYANYYYPIRDTVVSSAPTVTLAKPRMPEADEPPAIYSVPPAASEPAPRRPQPLPPADGAYPYDGPTKSRTLTPGYRYDGDPLRPVPMPAGASPPGKSPAPKIDPKDGRLVSIPAGTKKISYPAYGEHRHAEPLQSNELTVKRN